MDLEMQAKSLAEKLEGALAASRETTVQLNETLNRLRDSIALGAKAPVCCPTCGSPIPKSRSVVSVR
jgi:hypothetical protein